MTDPRELPLDWFQCLQFEKMSIPKNVGKTHWLDMSRAQIFTLLKVETIELRKALAGGLPPEEVISECVDVANFAVMLADKIATEQSDD